ncbi:SDR family oxidoreductase [Sneathiella aquimaris]|uniref:SDR family oxidoreductase n=1 Tax=Sneathiella aquimaris TaxID=2599305 RepID=UPI00146CDC7C|nr:SDR family oxidoreductase [Sneathiella aquimaris]
MTQIRPQDFTGKTALIFGASRGIGLATAFKLAEYGAEVILTARDQNDGMQAADDIRAKGGIAHFKRCDVSDYESVCSAVQYCQKETGRLDIVVNNAGVIEPLSYLADSDPELWSAAVDINLKGIYFSMRSAIPIMRALGGGIIVNLSSGAANSALTGWSHYCSTKAAGKKLTEIAQLEVAGHNIRIVGLSPGTVSTGMMDKIRKAQINAVSNLDPSVHIPAEWAAEAVAFLCGPGGVEFAGSDFSIKTPEGRDRVGLPSN